MEVELLQLKLKTLLSSITGTYYLGQEMEEDIIKDCLKIASQLTKHNS